ncbi:MAG: SPOR domain-containing protein [Balneolaceae bacterium]|nr:SPOR domain-containing protein [Balneolaceae bacterium]
MKLRLFFLVTGLLVVLGCVAPTGASSHTLQDQAVSDRSSTQRDTLGGVQSERSLGVFLGGVPGTGSVFTGLTGSNVLFGIQARHNFAGDLFGEARASIGTVNSRGGEARLIPLEYRLNVRLLPVLSAGKNRGEAISPYAYMGTGVLIHQTVEERPDPDPRTGNLGGKLPASSFFSLDDGVTPKFSFGVGFEIQFNTDVHLQVNAGGVRMLNEIPVRGKGYDHDYMEFSIGLNIRMGGRRDGIGSVEEPQPPEADVPPQIVEVKRGKEEAEEDSTGREGEMPHSSVRVDTLYESSCVFSVQVGGYESYSNALQAVRTLSDLTGEYPRIYLDSVRMLYVVRTSERGSLAESLEFLAEVREAEEFEDAMVYQSCEGSEATPIPYQVQVAAFGDSLRARNYVDNVNRRHGTALQIQRSDEGDVYRVRSRTYDSILEAEQALDELQNAGIGAEMFVARGEPPRTYRPTYRYLLQLGNYETLEEGLSQYRVWQPRVDWNLQLWHYLGEKSRVILGYMSTDWGPLRQQAEISEDRFPSLRTEIILVSEVSPSSP